MGWAYSYCRKCHAGLPRPTTREILASNQECPAGHNNPVSITQDELIVEMDERIVALEEKVAALTALM